MSDHRSHEPSDAQLAGAQRDLETLLEASGVGLGSPELWEPMPDLEDEIVNAISPRATAQPSRWLAAVGAVAAALILVVSSITLIGASEDPDWTVALAATDLFPAASGVAEGWNEASGTRVRLVLDELPPAPNGFIYELWFSADDIHISAGTFHDTGGVELWAGVGRADFPRVWITLEPIDDDESPSGQTVLDTA